jgi:hypothetical protein
MGWLSRTFESAKAFGKSAVDSAKTFVGKASGYASKGAELYQQGKQLVDQGAMVRSQVKALPIIGAVAGRLEGQAGQMIEKAAERGLSAVGLSARM